MSIKFRMINYFRFVKKIQPLSVLWHRHHWEDNVTSRYYGRYVEKKGKKRDQYYLEINQVVYSLHTVEDLVNLDHELFVNRLKKKLELDNLRPAASRLIMDNVMQGLYTERMTEGILELVEPSRIYKHIFTFAQLQ